MSNSCLQDKNNITKNFLKEKLESGKICSLYSVEQDDTEYKKWDLDKIKFELNKIYNNDGTFNSKTHKKLTFAIINRYDSLDDGLKKLNFIRDKNNYLKKLCPICGNKILNRYYSRYEFCKKCRNKGIKL